MRLHVGFVENTSETHQDTYFEPKFVEKRRLLFFVDRLNYSEIKKCSVPVRNSHATVNENHVSRDIVFARLSNTDLVCLD